MLRVLIVDDEPPARQRLRKLLEPLVASGRLTLLEEAADGFEALAKLHQQPFDLLLLDVRMPELDGFEVLERIDPDRRPFVVFTTAYDDYALKAFEAHAIDYLLKPVNQERLQEAISRVEHWQAAALRKAQEERLSQLLDWLESQQRAAGPPTPVPEGGYLQQLSIPYRDRILIVPVERLVSAEIHHGITRLYVLEEDTHARLHQHLVGYTLDQLEARLDPQAFMRVHRSAIVQLRHIRELVPWFSGRYKLLLTGNHEVIASRERSKLLKDRLVL
ncbi:LytR/AlgR family response regulator transcription factor [Rhodothermus bifroesti]|uniref:Response regulator transcription factor n=1 Tax=Rhodothermus marinus TaxID=29549 RepID=A0A7V2F584_RHOMR|nr:LytTR family DNA-binding domain-containing protein [Rhodothermus bifroesti]GBD00829.1 Sensory transduction protein LytR [bacterium HR18]